jgi:hypothetical protein
MNDNDLYHSPLELASGERLLGPPVRDGRFPGAWADLLVGRALQKLSSTLSRDLVRSGVVFWIVGCKKSGSCTFCEQRNTIRPGAAMRACTIDDLGASLACWSDRHQPESFCECSGVQTR